MVGIRSAVYNTLNNKKAIIYLVTLGPRAEQNLYIAELVVISIVIKYLLLDLQGRQITIFFSN